MNAIQARLREFERTILRPFVHRLKGRRPKVVVERAVAEGPEVPKSPGCGEPQPQERDRLEELVVALARTELRRRQAATPGGEHSADAVVMVAGHEPGDEISGLLRSLLDTDIPPTS